MKPGNQQSFWLCNGANSVRKQNNLSFLRDEDKTFTKKVLPLLFRRGFKFFGILKKAKSFYFT